jgi:hypothetical protein
LAGCAGDGVSLEADCFGSIFVAVEVGLPDATATDFWTALTASWVAFAIRSFSFSLSVAVEVALPLMITVGGRSFLAGFASLLALLAALACAASLALLAFFSLMYWTSGVIVMASGFASVDSVKPCKKSINSWSWSIVPCLPSCRVRPLGVLLYGANSSAEGPNKHGSLVVFLAS